MMGNGSTAGPLTLGMEEKNVVIVIRNEDPSGKRLMQTQLMCDCFVDVCCESRGSDPGENVGKERGTWRVDEYSGLQVRLMAG